MACHIYCDSSTRRGTERPWPARTWSAALMTCASRPRHSLRCSSRLPARRSRRGGVRGDRVGRVLSPGLHTPSLICIICGRRSQRFRSSEAFADYLTTPSAMDALRQEPLLHLTQKQRGMIGEERANQAMRAQLEGRGLEKMSTSKARPAQPSYVTSTSHKNASVDAKQWAAEVVRSVSASIRKTGNRVCRPDVCYNRQERLLSNVFLALGSGRRQERQRGG